MRYLKLILLVMCMVVFAGGAGWAGSPDADTDTEGALIEMLRDNGTLTPEQYKALKQTFDEGRVPDEPVATKPVPLDAVWDKGLHFVSPEGAFDIQVGGRILQDWAAIDADSEAGDALDGLEGTGTNMRQARLFAGGTLYGRFPFSAEFEFLDSEADIVEVWMGISDVPALGEIRVGHQKEAFSLERMNSAKYTVFIERGLPVALVPSRNSGIKFHNDLGVRFAWGVGFYKDTGGSDDFGNESDYNVSARVTALPFASEDLSRLVHVGLSYSHQFRSGNTLRYRSGPETAVTDAYTVNTADIPGVDGVDLVGPELAMVWGPLSLQGEYVHSFADAAGADDPDFYGYYLFASWFFTGEHRAYKLGEAGGEFARVKPRRYFNPGAGGWGAWEGAIRYSYLDLNDEGIEGGEQADWTAGLNCYLNANLRWALNYIRADIEDRNSDGIIIDDSGANIWLTRFQVDF